jgi:small-conductance mechanosensitive channel
MKTHNVFLKTLALGAFAAMMAVLATFAFAPAPIASADPGTPPAEQGKVGDALEKLYQRQLKMLDQQKEQLTRAHTLLDKAHDFIDQQKAQGKDVTKLEKAVAKVEEQIDKAQAAHDEAAIVLNAHAGFDANGKVTDSAQARQTVTQAQKSLREAQRILTTVTAEVRRVLDHLRNVKSDK